MQMGNIEEGIKECLEKGKTYAELYPEIIDINRIY